MAEEDVAIWTMALARASVFGYQSRMVEESSKPVKMWIVLLVHDPAHFMRVELKFDPVNGWLGDPSTLPFVGCCSIAVDFFDSLPSQPGSSG